MKPLGFDWRMGVSLLTGISAKEIVVSTLGVLFLADGSADLDSNLAGKLKNATHFSGSKQGQPVFTGASALSFLLFILIYFPCVAVVATIRKESGGWKWALFTVGYTTAVAWLVAFITFQTSQLFL